MLVTVRGNNVGQALKVLKRKLQQEGLFQEMRRMCAYEKPSEKRRRKHAAAVRRRRKAERRKWDAEDL